MLGASKNLCDSWEEGSIATRTGVWKGVRALTEDVEGFGASVEEAAADVVETARGLDGEPEDAIESLPPHGRA